MDMKERRVASGAGNDLPVSTPEEDRYGFSSLAENLAHSILSLDAGVSTVIGIEGAWGAGKTSLLNLLRLRLVENRPENTHIIPVSPWLSTTGSSVENLLLPVAAILNEEQEKRYSWLRRRWRNVRKSRASALATDVLRYAQQASGRIAPLAELAGEWIPGGGVAAKIMKTVSAVDLSARRQTTAALRAEIEGKIAALDLNFIVVLDDLDRLEPAQAVEVLRMVRSVADFSRFRYILCYDPAVLGHAVEVGLNVQNGRHYLQKIVPLSFSLPRPESFDLRREFLNDALQLFEKVSGSEADYATLRDIKSVAGTFGAMLSTPREVRLTLSSLAFRYPPLKDYVWFPDLCRLQLLRITAPELYDWTEHYLTEHATVASGSGQVTEKEVASITHELLERLSTLPAVSPLTVTDLARFLPGIEGYDEKSLKLFIPANSRVKAVQESDKRLSSGFYWRFYFAFTPPKDVLSPDFFDDLFRMAGNTAAPEELSEFLFNQMTSNGFSGRWWFDHIMDRLTPELLERASRVQCLGLLECLFRNGQEIFRRYQARGEWLTMADLEIKELADKLLRRLTQENRKEALKLLEHSLTDEKSFCWTISYLRHLLWQNGLAGNRPAYEYDRVLDDAELRKLCAKTAAWLEVPEHIALLWKQEDPSDLIYAWREISTPEKVAMCLSSATRSDSDFLQVLLWLRFKGISTAAGRYYGLRMSVVQDIFGGGDAVSERLKDIESEGKFPEEIRLIREAITMGRD